MSWALIGFVFAGLFSPGPNVILLTTSGARFGFRPTVPHILGVAIGVGVTSGLTGLGIGAVLAAAPGLELSLKVAAAGWIAVMAWRLWVSRPVESDPSARPFTFLEAVLFQWVNPKVWAVALAATAYVVELSAAEQAVTLALTFSTLNLGVCLFWTSTGHFLGWLLQNPSAWTSFMRVMAAALVVFSVLIFV